MTTLTKAVPPRKLSLSALPNTLWSSGAMALVVLAVIVGIGSGLGTIVFIRMISFFNNLFFGYGSRLTFLGSAFVIILPVLGGLLVGPLVHFVAPEAKGHGVPEVLTAIHTKGGRIRPIVVLAKPSARPSPSARAALSGVRGPSYRLALPSALPSGAGPD